MTETARFTVACAQMRSGQDPAANIAAADVLIREAAGRGADIVMTPEMTSLMVTGRRALFEAIHPQGEDPALAAFKALADELSVWLLAGSLAVRVSETQAANRSVLISPEGRVVATYDKIHMFDVDLDNGESYRESRTYLAGDRGVLAALPWGRLGMTVCYDVRFPHLYRALAQAGADFLSVPAAFTRQTGEAHWHVLLRARAIETGAFVFAPAQGGVHDNGRATYGHSLVVSPWGEILAEADGEEPGVILAEIDTAEIARARQRVPSLSHGRRFSIDTPSHLEVVS
ncbi:carbon-nitrogen hydrolase family protein [Kaustia mangrovi]|uniref:Carbon-nitrogen hydrolase family protein n=1 Tax=Kaustia mangrovi TaxID=2593653 RepID=A0A7S8HBX7_9HYPH|nr:carbon-nitrogen hydrolase family protein [Kaustia mangrovi]QPC43050.1 carbon-nitrogen hydrolase family protein [Kaustia mangrovi]